MAPCPGCCPHPDCLRSVRVCSEHSPVLRQSMVFTHSHVTVHAGGLQCASQSLRGRGHEHLRGSAHPPWTSTRPRCSYECHFQQDQRKLLFATCRITTSARNNAPSVQDVSWNGIRQRLNSLVSGVVARERACALYSYMFLTGPFIYYLFNMVHVISILQCHRLSSVLVSCPHMHIELP